MSGYVAMSRQWHDHELFAGDEYSRRDAWSWLIADAAWKPKTVIVGRRKIEIGRGELSHSVRFMAEKWGWSKSGVSRFLNKLQREKMVEIRAISGGTASGTASGTVVGTVQNIITICNYNKFQAAQSVERDSYWDAERDSKRDKEEEYKPVKEKKEVTPPSGATAYAFAGKIIRLTQADFDQWATSYPALDLRAVLQSRDDWLHTEADAKTRKKWFVSTSNYLKNLQQQATTETAEEARPGLGALC